MRAQTGRGTRRHRAEANPTLLVGEQVKGRRGRTSVVKSSAGEAAALHASSAFRRRASRLLSRLRDALIESIGAGPARNAVEFEQQVGALLDVFAEEVFRQPEVAPGARPDFVVTFGSAIVVVEAKYIRPDVIHWRLQREAVWQVGRFIEAAGATGGVVVVPDTYGPAEMEPEFEDVVVTTPSRLEADLMRRFHQR